VSRVYCRLFCRQIRRFPRGFPRRVYRGLTSGLNSRHLSRRGCGQGCRLNTGGGRRHIGRCRCRDIRGLNSGSPGRINSRHCSRIYSRHGCGVWCGWQCWWESRRIRRGLGGRTEVCRCQCCWHKGWDAGERCRRSVARRPSRCERRCPRRCPCVGRDTGSWCRSFVQTARVCHPLEAALERSCQLTELTSVDVGIQRHIALAAAV